MIPPRRTEVTRPPALLTKPRTPARRDVIGQARSYQARSWWAARSYQGRTSKVATHARATQGKPAKSLSSRWNSLRSHSHQHHCLRRANGRSVEAVRAKHSPPDPVCRLTVIIGPSPAANQRQLNRRVRHKPGYRGGPGPPRRRAMAGLGGAVRDDDVFRAGRLPAVVGDRFEGERAWE